MPDFNITLELFKLALALGLLGIGYMVGRAGIPGTITDIKNDISTIKNWIDPTKTTTVVGTPATVVPTVVTAPATNVVV